MVALKAVIGQYVPIGGDDVDAKARHCMKRPQRSSNRDIVTEPSVQ